VAANSYLRKELKLLGTSSNWNIYIPDFQYCTDNAAMIAITAYYKYLNGSFDDHEITAFAKQVK